MAYRLRYAEAPDEVHPGDARSGFTTWASCRYRRLTAS